ncbi:MAG: hypothetical protein RL701_1794, partial [Pseudomonadota bacterium]
MSDVQRQRARLRVVRSEPATSGSVSAPPSAAELAPEHF